MGWKMWGAVGVVVLLGVGAVVNDPAADDATRRSSADAPIATAAATPADSTQAAPAAALLQVTDLKDGDSWVASDDQEYRLGLVNTPERNEPCASEATAFTENFLASGFTTDSYSRDRYDRVVAEVFDANGTSLNVALAENGLGDDRYLEQFRRENPDLAERIEDAMSSAAVPECAGAAAAAPLVEQPAPVENTPDPAKGDCAKGYSPCLPVVADLNCPDVGGPVTVTGGDPYGLDRDGDGIGCV